MKSLEYPYISIIIPSYNSELYIERCIHSCISQETKYTFEIIICDDGSTDKTREIIEFVYGENPQVRVTSNKENLGVGLTRNNAIRFSKGRYIYLLDSDDYIHPFTLEMMTNALELSPNKDLVYSDYVYIDDNGQKSSSVSSYERPIACGQLITKSIFIQHGLYQDKRIGEDQDFQERVLKKANRLHLEVPLYRYRQHKLSITAEYESKRSYDCKK